MNIVWKVVVTVVAFFAALWIASFALEIALWMTIDLDYPGMGIIRVSNLSLVETLAAMN